MIYKHTLISKIICFLFCKILSIYKEAELELLYHLILSTLKIQNSNKMMIGISMKSKYTKIKGNKVLIISMKVIVLETEQLLCKIIFCKG